jgi:hypothetical protein
MRLKRELYKNEQLEIMNEILSIIQLDSFIGVSEFNFNFYSRMIMGEE